MLPVYICEDNAQIRAELESYLKKQILIEKYDMRLTLSTRHPEDIIAAIRKTPGRGIYFLDVELNGESMDGFALGQEIRRHDTRGFIIYVTAYKELAFETFRYHLEALDYITKENQEKMYAGMSRCLHIITDPSMRFCFLRQAAAATESYSMPTGTISTLSAACRNWKRLLGNDLYAYTGPI